ncbi:MAG: hypothetical protein Ta2F_11410 [Termitinemataceae bacterium]|nr:MAG: hypothetical protein Ta2F_11410 [Termitinemataceae bacterium]
MLKILIFCYDVLRFFLLTFCLGFAKSLDSNTVDTFFFPMYSYVTAIALFPIMSFFLWVNPTKNAPFKYLYAAGKTINAIIVLEALIVNLNVILPVVQFWNRSKWIINSVFPIMILIDILTVIIFLKRK